MFKFGLAGNVALHIVLLCAGARGQTTVVPPNSVSQKTSMMFYMEAAAFNPESATAAVKVVLGANAAALDEPLKKFKEKYDKLVTSGVTAMTGIMYEDENGPPRVVSYFHTKPGADLAVAQSAVEAALGDSDRESRIIERQGTYVTVRDKGTALAATADPARAALFANALEIADKSTIVVAMIPTEGMRKILAIGGGPLNGMNEVAPILATARFSTMAWKLGQTPSATITVNTENEDSAKRLSIALNKMFDDAKEKAAAPDRGALSALASLIDDLRPTTTGAQVSLSAKTPTLVRIGSAVGASFLPGPGQPPK